MRRLFVVASAVSALLGVAPCAWAEPIWSYSWSASPSVVSSDDGLGKVTISTGPGGPMTGSVTGGNGILAATLTATAPATGSATWTNQGYGLTMHLTDQASGTSGDLTFKGAFNGQLGAVNTLDNTFQQPFSKSITLGGNQYAVTVGLLVPPLPGTTGKLGANVVVTPGSGTTTPPVNSVPEPTSLLLAGIGACAVGLRAWRRRAGTGIAKSRGGLGKST